MLTQRASRPRGFTLVELMVTISLLAILTMLAMPSMSEWIRNSRIRAVTDTLQNGIRLAQAESLRRSRQVVFSLTDSKPTAASSNVTAKTNGLYWAIHTIPSLTSETAEFVEAGILSDVGAGVKIEGPAALCFNSIGRVVANASPGTGAACALPTGTPPVQAYDIKIENETGLRPLRVLVGLGGQVRLCDPAKSLASYPDGCPS